MPAAGLLLWAARLLSRKERPNSVALPHFVAYRNPHPATAVSFPPRRFAPRIRMTTALRFVAVLTLLVSCFSSLRAQDAPAVQPDVVYGHKDGMALTFDLFRPAKPNGA